jgi:hypothetical protein
MMGSALITLRSDDLERFHKLGIPEELLTRAGIRRVTDQEARQDFGLTGMGDNSGIVFPYLDAEGVRRTCRLRRDNPEIDNGKPIRKYLAPYGDRRHLYVVRGDHPLALDQNIPVVLIEAEKSALALRAWADRNNRELFPMAMGGCWGFRGRIGLALTPYGERVPERGPLPELAVCRDGRRVYVLLDANCTTNPRVQAARRALITQLLKQKAIVNVLDLPVFEGVNGPDDLIAIKGDAAMADVFDSPPAPSEYTSSKRSNTRVRARERLLKLGSDFELFHTDEREAFASVRISGHMETWPIKSRDFALILQHRYYLETRSGPPSQALQEAIEVYRSRALFDAPERVVSLRVAEKERVLYLDLGNKDWNVVEISSDGWRILRDSPVRFRRPYGLKSLPLPFSGGDLNDLRCFLNVPDEDWPLILAWILSGYRPRGPYPVLSWNGEQGSCKSTTTRVLRELIDPNSANLRSSPRDERDMFVAANNSWVTTGQPQPHSGLALRCVVSLGYRWRIHHSSALHRRQ